MGQTVVQECPHSLEVELFRFLDPTLYRAALHSDYAKALTWRDGNTLISGGWDGELRFTKLGQTGA